MLGDVGQPQLVRPVGGEVAVDEIVVHGWARFLIAAFAGRDRRADPRDVTQPPHTPLRQDIAEICDVVGQDPVPALRVILVQFPEHPDQMRFLDLTRADRVLEPLVIRLLGESQNPARHRDRHPNGGAGRGHLTDEREDHFGGKI